MLNRASLIFALMLQLFLAPKLAQAQDSICARDDLRVIEASDVPQESQSSISLSYARIELSVLEGWFNAVAYSDHQRVSVSLRLVCVVTDDTVSDDSNIAHDRLLFFGAPEVSRGRSVDFDFNGVEFTNWVSLTSYICGQYGMHGVRRIHISLCLQDQDVFGIEGYDAEGELTIGNVDIRSCRDVENVRISDLTLDYSDWPGAISISDCEADLLLLEDPHDAEIRGSTIGSIRFDGAILDNAIDASITIERRDFGDRCARTFEVSVAGENEDALASLFYGVPRGTATYRAHCTDSVAVRGSIGDLSIEDVTLSGLTVAAESVRDLSLVDVEFQPFNLEEGQSDEPVTLTIEAAEITEFELHGLSFEGPFFLNLDPVRVSGSNLTPGSEMFAEAELSFDYTVLPSMAALTGNEEAVGSFLQRVDDWVQVSDYRRPHRLAARCARNRFEAHGFEASYPDACDPFLGVRY